MKQSTLIKYKLLAVLVLFIFLLIFSIYAFKEGIKNKKRKNKKKPKTTPTTTPTTTSPTTSTPTTSTTTTTPTISSLILDSTIADGNYIIMSDQFKNALSAYPSPAKCENLNIKKAIFSISNEFSVTDIWTVKTVNNKTTIHQNNCNYLQLNTLEGFGKNTGIIDPNTQILQIDDKSENVFYWKINKNSEDNTYTLVPYDNQNITIYNYIVKSQGMDLNAFISNNNNDINNKIAKFKFNKIS